MPPAVAKYIADADPFVRGTTKAVEQAKRFDRDASKAALSARRMGLAAKEAGEKAAVAGRVAAEAAEKAAKGMLAESEAARLAARAVKELERAELAQAAAALASAEASEKAARAHRAQAADGAKATKSASLMRNELVTLAAGGAAIAPAFVAAGAGVSAFGALAFPTIKKVVESQEKMAETWDSLSGRQKVASVSTRMLVDQYKGLATAVEPDVLRVYNNALAVTAGVMPRLAPLTKAASGALVEFENKIESALNSDRATQFFRFVEAEAGPAMDVLGDTLGSASHLAVSLTESLAPLAGAGLGVVGMVADLTAGLTDLSPELAQLAVLGIGLRGPLGSAAEGLGKVGQKYKTATAGAVGASKATKLLNVAAAAGPNIYMAAGLAIAYFGLKALNAKSNTDRLVESITVANRAVGNNIEGYRAANRALDAQLAPATNRAATAAQTLTGNVTLMNAQMYQGAEVAKSLTQEWVNQAKSDNDRKIRSVTLGAAALAKQYGITTTQAVSLADAVGVDMSRGITENGRVVASAAAKFDRYRQAVEMARNPTAVVAQAWADAGNQALTLKDQVNAAATALDAFFNPALNVLSATNRMKDALAASNKVLKNSKATTLERSKALEAQLGPLGTWVSAQVAAKKSVSLTDSAIRQQLPSLVRLAAGNRAGQAALAGFVTSMGGTISRTKAGTTIVDRFGNRVKVLPNGKVVVIKAKTGQADSALAATKGRLDSLNSKTLTITTFFKQIGQQANAAPRTARAEGGPVDGPGTETSDSIPAWLSKNEYVINARSTKKHLGLIEAINADKFAEGGMVGYARGGRAKKNVTHVGGVEVSTTAWRNIGLTLGKEFFKAMTGSKSEIASMDRRLEKAVAKLFAGKRTTLDNRLIHYLDRNSSRLEALSVRRDAATKALAAGKQYASQITSNARSFAGLSSLDGPTSGAQIRQGLQMKLSGLTQYAGVLKALGKRGLSKSLLRQVMDMGPEDGLKYGQMLLSADKGTFKDINAVQAQVDKTSRSLGRNSADMLYDAGKMAGRGFLTGLEGEIKSLDKSMDKLAKHMAKSIKKALHLKSPSRLPAIRHAGAMTVAGLAAGMDANLGVLDQSTARAAARIGRSAVAPRPVMRAPSVPLSGRGAVVQQVIHVHVAGSVWAERDLFQVVQRQALQHNRRNTSNGLSLTGTRG
ncbi:hypothetical protein [Streptosporangium sp. NPDC006007]|uniref:hypothetical protein n=1 Tax=Streptosporangium sp. NPDC006007 TaxID=3154575 RepID=UPI0033B1E15B